MTHRRVDRFIARCLSGLLAGCVGCTTVPLAGGLSSRSADHALALCGGGLGNSIVNTGGRWDADAVAWWEVCNLGLSDRAARQETSLLVRQAQLRELAILDRVAREVAEAHVQVLQRQQRIEVARAGVVAAEKSDSRNLQRIENAEGLPMEVLQAIQALANARQAY